MASFTPTSAETLEDRRLYTQARLVEVACLDCLATVGVKKNSEHHTSIQWTDPALRQCQEFARMAAHARRTAGARRLPPTGGQHRGRGARRTGDDRGRGRVLTWTRAPTW